MSDDEFLEMESVCDTDEFDRDVQTDMVNEEAGETTTFVCSRRFVLVAFCFSSDIVHVKLMLGHKVTNHSFITGLKLVLRLGRGAIIT